MNAIKSINNFYELKSDGKIFPFIDKNKITEIKKGYHKKKRSKHYGLTLIYDNLLEEYKTILMGYYYVPENYLIVPDNIIFNRVTNNFIEEKKNLGYKIINKPPSLKPITFKQDSFEHKLISKLYDKTNNG
jgi:hypothetical protein